ncbi:hypothetical protein, variant [Verruconis gallopava]|nr:hypothetical protein, variant [Verruconis gallopava]KIV99050.1 hypothetical protein, variant [Verruconis gallopava]
MHHFLTSIRPFLAVDDLSKPLRLWDGLIQRQGVVNTYVLYNILSLSAFHLAIHTQASQSKYLARGIYYQNKALSQMVPNSHRVTEETCEGMFTSSLLVVTCCFAMGRAIAGVGEGNLDMIRRVVEISRLMRGTLAIFRAGWQLSLDKQTIPHIRRSFITLNRQMVPESPGSDGSLDMLTRRIEANVDDKERKLRYFQAIAFMKTSIRKASSRSTSCAFLLVVVGRISDELLVEMEAREPIPLILLAHWAVQLHWAKDTWWLATWGQRVVEVVRANLDTAWWDYIRWPLTEVGMLSHADGQFCPA